MKRYLPLLLAILLFIPTLALGCDKPTWTERAAIDYLYTHLASKADQWHNAYGKAEKIVIEWQFRNAIIEANKRAIEEDFPNLGNSVNMQFGAPLADFMAWEGALNRIAKYDGEGWWSLNVGDSLWQINETTKEVVARNEKATELLEKTIVKTYHSERHGFYLDYPPAWTTIEQTDSKIWIFPPNAQEGAASIYVHIFDQQELIPFRDLQGYILAKVALFQSGYAYFKLVEANAISLEYYYKFENNSPLMQAKRHFLQQGGKVYEVASWAAFTEVNTVMGSTNLYDPFESLRFQP